MRHKTKTFKSLSYTFSRIERGLNQTIIK